MSPDVSGTHRAQAALLPGTRVQRTSPVCPPCAGPGAPRRAQMSVGMRGGDGLSAARLAAPLHPARPTLDPGCLAASTRLLHMSLHISALQRHACLLKTNSTQALFGDVVDYVTVDHLSIIV